MAYISEPSKRDMQQCKRLWIDVFGDDEEFVEQFIYNYYTQQNMHHIINSRGEIVAMLHVVPFSGDMGRVAYIYGVATAPHYRGRGYANSIMQYTIKQVAKQGYDAALLIPSEEWLKRFYGQFGFIEWGRVEFKSADNFDFGPGDVKNNISMIATISSQGEEYIKKGGSNFTTLYNK